MSKILTRKIPLWIDLLAVFTALDDTPILDSVSCMSKLMHYMHLRWTFIYGWSLQISLVLVAL